MLARLTPSSDASRLARGDALTSGLPATRGAPSAPLGADGVGGGAFGGGCGGGVFFSDLGASLGFTSPPGREVPPLAAGVGAPASPMRAIGAPILAGTPCSTRIFRTPSASDSRSNVALSDSTSAITSPFLTGSPVFFFHSTTVPSSIVSESLGMFTSAIERLPADHLSGHFLDIFAGWDRRLLERQAVWHRHLRAAQPSDRGVQVVEAALLHARGDLGRDAIRRPALLDHQAARRAANRLDDR